MIKEFTEEEGFDTAQASYRITKDAVLELNEASMQLDEYSRWQVRARVYERMRRL